MSVHQEHGRHGECSPRAWQARRVFTKSAAGAVSKTHYRDTVLLKNRFCIIYIVNCKTNYRDTVLLKNLKKEGEVEHKSYENKVSLHKMINNIHYVALKDPCNGWKQVIADQSVGTKGEK